MRIQIFEDPGIEETEVTIRCREADEQLMQLVSRLRMYERKLIGIRDGSTYILDPREILYIDTADRKTFFYTGDAVYETVLKLYELEERLAASDFIRISKSCIVNFFQIRSLRPEFGGRMILTMNNGEKLCVSRQYAGTIKKKLGVI